MPSRSGILIVLFARTAFAQTDFMLSGRVTDAVTNLPIAGAQVDWCCGRTSAKTDANGEWLLHVVPAGSEADVSVEKSGYAPVNLAVPGPTTSRLLNFELRAAARLSGRIVDRDSGQPLAGFAVLANRRVGRGKATFMAEPSAADGSFVLKADLDPGDYILEIDPPSGARIHPASAKPDEPGYGRTYFPDVSRFEMASPVTLSSGENRVIELHVHKRELYHVAGAFQAPEGLQDDVIAISLTSGGQIVRPLVAGEVSKGGPFRIDGLDEGSYHLEAILKSAKGDALAFGGESVELTRQSIDDLKVTMRSPIGVTARVAVAEDHAEMPKGLRFDLGEFSVPYFAGVSGFLKIRLSQDHLSLYGYPAGEYWPMLKIPEGYAVTSMNFNGRSVLNSTVDLESPKSVVSYTLTSRPASVSGIVRDSNQNTVPGTIVVLLPGTLPDSLERFDPTAARVTTADGNGGFRFTSLAPGRYKAIVLAAGDRDRVTRVPDLDFLLTQASSTVDLDFGQDASLDLRTR